MLISGALLAEGGIIACDNFLNSIRPGASQAVSAYLALGAGFVAFAYIQNKLFLCHKSAHRELFEATL